MSKKFINDLIGKECRIIPLECDGTITEMSIGMKGLMLYVRHFINSSIQEEFFYPRELKLKVGNLANYLTILNN